MRLLNTSVAVMQCKKPNNHKWDVYITKNYIDNFGKEFVEQKLWDTCLSSELELQTEIAKKRNGLEYNKKIVEEYGR